MTPTTARMGFFCLALCLPSLALAEAPATGATADQSSAQNYATVDSTRFPKAAHGVRRAEAGVSAHVRRTSAPQRSYARYPVIVGIAY